MRSTKCVELVRNKLGRKTKVGHGGTLDSTASGLLIILIGAATRLSNFVMDMPKSYETVACLGVETSTDDASGEIICRKAVEISTKKIDLALPFFWAGGCRLRRYICSPVDGRRDTNCKRGNDVISKRSRFFLLFL